MSLERGDRKTSVHVDRFGALPVDLLHHVLSFLPEHEVVRTCQLARRWRHLWKSAAALRVTGVKGCNNAAWFVNFVHTLLLLRDPSVRLDSFELDLDEHDFDFKAFLPAYEADVNLWFRHAVACGPRVLLALRTTNGIYDYQHAENEDPLGLPNLPLISQRITRLELHKVYLRSSTLDFSGCPALVHLRMENCEIEGNISSPFLKHLSLIYCYFQTDPFRGRICLPSLVSLELTGSMRRIPVLADTMPLLASAVVRIYWAQDSCTKSDYGDCDPHCHGCYNPEDFVEDMRGKSVLLKGLSQVAELELLVHPQVFIVNRDLRLCPTFSNLKNLLLCEWCPGIASDLNVLSCFLKHSPILEKLILQLSEEPKVPVETQRSYIPPEQSFACSHLKIVKIQCECDEVDGRALKVLYILSTYGIPFEKVDVQKTHRTSRSQW